MEQSHLIIVENSLCYIQNVIEIMAHADCDFNFINIVSYKWGDARIADDQHDFHFSSGRLVGEAIHRALTLHRSRCTAACRNSVD